ncbi:MAG: phage major capsid protein, partial [Sciscionella sp.]
MSEIVTRLRERRAQVWEQAKEIADRASEEGRSFNGQEEEQWQKLNAELDALDKRVQNVIDGEQRAKETEEAFSKLEGKPVTQRGSNAQTPGGGGTNEELRKFLRGEGPRFYEVRSDKPVNFRALSVGAATGGGDTVPTSFYDRLVQHLIVNAAIMQAGVTVIQTNGGETIQVPKTTAHSSAARISEGSAIPEADPSFGQVPLNAYKYGALIQISRELLDDTGVDLEGYLAME